VAAVLPLQPRLEWSCVACQHTTAVYIVLEGIVGGEVKQLVAPTTKVRETS
jgi:hypothetical protein